MPKKRNSAKKRRPRVIVYWLIPAKPQRELLRQIIDILASQFDAPRFEPHLTIFATAKDRGSPRKVLQRIKVSPFRLTVGGIAFSSQFTKTLFVRLKNERAIEKLSSDLAGLTHSPRKSVRDPHVSLLYKKLPTLIKRELASTIRLPFARIAFDSLKAMRCTSPTRTPAEVRAWRVVATRKF